MAHHKIWAILFFFMCKWVRWVILCERICENFFILNLRFLVNEWFCVSATQSTKNYHIRIIICIAIKFQDFLLFVCVFFRAYIKHKKSIKLILKNEKLTKRLKLSIYFPFWVQLSAVCDFNQIDKKKQRKKKKAI